MKKVHIGHISEIAVKRSRVVRIGDLEIAVFKLSDGVIKAIENRCPHKGGPLVDGIIGSNKVVCPLHGHKFDLTTGQGSESQECVKTFKVWEENKNIVILFDFAAMKSENKNCATH